MCSSTKSRTPEQRARVWTYDRVGGARGKRRGDPGHQGFGHDFKFVATMNPGGDYGKKGLSPALRNRFTEIWVPPITDRRDLECIDTLWQHEVLRGYSQPLLDFVEWLCAAVGDRAFANLRDLLVRLVRLVDTCMFLWLISVAGLDIFLKGCHQPQHGYSVTKCPLRELTYPLIGR